MAFWVLNNYKTPFNIKWGDLDTVLNPEDWGLLTNEAVRAFFPTYEDIKRFLPSDEISAIKEARGLVEIYRSRWGTQIDKYQKLTGNINVDVDNFFKFIEGFNVSIEKSENPRRNAKGITASADTKGA